MTLVLQSTCSKPTFLNGCNIDVSPADTGGYEYMADYGSAASGGKREEVETLQRPGPQQSLPCMVCGNRASGLHFGVHTCESCKGFFRRSLRKPVDYTCRCGGTGDKGTGTHRRYGCRSCRYRKCLSLGMSVEGIKRGRYTTSQKTRTIQQLKALEGSEAPSPEISAELRIHQSPVPASHALPLPEMSKQEMDTILTNLLVAHEKAMKEIPTLCPPIGQDETKKRHEAAYMQYMTRTQDPEPFDPEPLLKHMSSNVRNAVLFAKAVPGFRSLTLEDQALLVKGAKVELFMFIEFPRAVIDINPALQVITSPWGTTYHFSQIGTASTPDLLKHRLSVARRFQQLNLTVEELVLLRAITVMTSDRIPLQEPARVDEIQNILVTCLLERLNTRETRDRTIFYKIIDLLVEMRTLTELTSEFSQHFLLAPASPELELIKECFS